ncbi:MAG: hypothetical protein ACSLE8_06130 [Rhodococcus sp. (in: high G+C Gram-positive bacteria)]
MKSEFTANLCLADTLKYVKVGTQTEFELKKRARVELRNRRICESLTLTTMFVLGAFGLWMMWTIGMPISTLPIFGQVLVTLSAVVFLAVTVYALVAFAFIK